jgi:hypothetical protein
MTEKSENILIGYTKWLLKWAAILCVILGVAIGGWLGYDQYQNQVVPMVAIKCLSPDWKEDGLKVGRFGKERFYLIQRKRDKTKPSALYRPAYFRKEIILTLKPEDFWEQYSFLGTGRAIFGDKEVGNAVRFGPESWEDQSGLVEHQIVRETLQVFFHTRKNKDSEWEREELSDCEEITYDEFLAESKRGLEEAQSKLKF